MIATACNASSSQYHVATHCGQLPFTGSNVTVLILVALALIAIGAMAYGVLAHRPK